MLIFCFLESVEQYYLLRWQEQQCFVLLLEQYYLLLIAVGGKGKGDTRKTNPNPDDANDDKNESKPLFCHH